jgi:lipopolysaccharide biosynthesis protein
MHELKSRIEKSTACSLIIVLGMHRSGTSAITRGLQALGANLGDTLMPPVPGDNDKGFWEDIDINALNIEMLKTVGGDWFSLTLVGMPDIELLRSEGFLLRATELLREKMNASAVFAFKDPRVAKLLPFWNQAAEHLRLNAGYVLALRNPLSVAKSLAKRDHLFAEHSYLLWLGHVLESLRGSEGKPRVMVDYDRLMQNPDVELGRVACALHLEMDAAEFEDYKTNFLDHQLQHTVYQPEDLWLDNACPPIVREIYARLLDVASDRTSIDDPVLGSEIRKWLQEFERFSASLKLADKQLERLTSQHQALAERDRDLATLTHSLSAYEARIDQLEKASEDQTRRIQAMRNVLEQADTERQDIKNLQKEVSALTATIEQYSTSRSWRLTKPLRRLNAAICGAKLLLKRAHKTKTEDVGSAWERVEHATRIGDAPEALCHGHNLPLPAHEKSERDALDFGRVVYVPVLNKKPLSKKEVKIICFYLPQFHTFPENDAWWGDGFTEWTNVRPAKPKFFGHYQPHVPGELGYYNLLDPAVQRRQIELAKLYGIEGFCFYFYWFAGHRLMETPIRNYLNDDSLDLPFCFCWANENWTRRWDGLDAEVLISQKHSPEDDLAFISHISEYLQDPRYIRINGKPLLLVYRPNLLPSAKNTAQLWRQWCRENGIGEIYLAYTQSFEVVNPAIYGFDAAVEFPPINWNLPDVTHLAKPVVEEFSSSLYDWQALVTRSMEYRDLGYKIFRGINPGWDNTARRKKGGSVLINSNPRDYQNWLCNAICDTKKRFVNYDERLIFVNAWNEWAEGAHLEPDMRYGYAYLEATRMAQVRAMVDANIPKDEGDRKLAVVVHAFYRDIFLELLDLLADIHSISIKLFVTTPRDQCTDIDLDLKKSGFKYCIFPVENRGRDVLPFLAVMPRVMEEDFDYVLKLHTKKSTHRDDGDVWRTDIFGKLVGEEACAAAFDQFEKNADIGIIGPSGHLVPMDYYWGSNAQRVEVLAFRLGQKMETVHKLSFVAGTMFYARINALNPLFNLAIEDSEFEAESGQIDGTLAHAFERAIAISCYAAGYKLAESNGLENPNLNYQFASMQADSIGLNQNG